MPDSRSPAGQCVGWWATGLAEVGTSAGQMDRQFMSRRRGMRALALWILAFGVAASPAIVRAAGTGDDKDSAATKKPADTAKADNKTPTASSNSEAPAK